MAHGEDQIEVKIWAKDDEVNRMQPTLSFEAGEVDYVSLINEGTYGIPPLLARDKDGPARAQTDDIVLYVNPGEIVAMTIEKVS